MATKKGENVRRNVVMNNAKYHRETNKIMFKKTPKVFGNTPHFWLQQQEQFQQRDVEGNQVAMECTGN